MIADSPPEQVEALHVLVHRDEILRRGLGEVALYLGEAVGSLAEFAEAGKRRLHAGCIAAAVEAELRVREKLEDGQRTVLMPRRKSILCILGGSRSILLITRNLGQARRLILVGIFVTREGRKRLGLVGEAGRGSQSQEPGEGREYGGSRA